MDQKERLPNLAQDLVRIHKVISRGLNVSMTRGSEFLLEGFPDQSIRQGFTDYLRSLVSVIAAHHLGEDEIAFPALKDGQLAAPYGRLGADHKKIEAALNPVIKTFSEAAGENPTAGLEVVVKGLKEVSAIWKPHINMEEKSFASTAIAEKLSPEEQAQVSVSLGKYAQEHAGPPFLVLPFVLFNLAGADRADMENTLPKMVVEQLIPGEWKERWSPMKPFLLD